MLPFPLPFTSWICPEPNSSGACSRSPSVDERRPLTRAEVTGQPGLERMTFRLAAKLNHCVWEPNDSVYLFLTQWHLAARLWVIPADVISCCLNLLPFADVRARCSTSPAFSASVRDHSSTRLTHRLAYLKGGELMFMSSSWRGGETLG